MQSLRLFIASLLLSLFCATPGQAQDCHSNVFVYIDESPSMAPYRARAIERLKEVFGQFRQGAYLDNEENFVVRSFSRPRQDPRHLTTRVSLSTTRENRHDLVDSLDTLDARILENYPGGPGTTTDLGPVLDDMANEMGKNKPGQNFYIIVSDFVHTVPIPEGYDGEKLLYDLNDWRGKFEALRKTLEEDLRDPGKNILLLFVAPVDVSKDPDGSDAKRQGLVLNSLANVVMPRDSKVFLDRNGGIDENIKTFLRPLWLGFELNEDGSLRVSFHNTTCRPLKITSFEFTCRPNNGTVPSVPTRFRPSDPIAVPVMGGSQVLSVSVPADTLRAISSQEPFKAEVTARGCLVGTPAASCGSELLSQSQSAFFHDWILIGSVGGRVRNHLLARILRLDMEASGYVGRSPEAHVELYRGDGCQRGDVIGKSGNIASKLKNLRIEKKISIVDMETDIADTSTPVCSHKAADLSFRIMGQGVALSDCRNLSRFAGDNHQGVSEKPHDLLEHVSLPLTLVVTFTLIFRGARSLSRLSDALSVSLVISIAAFGILHAFIGGSIEDSVSTHLRGWGFGLTGLLIFTLLACIRLGVFEGSKSLVALRAEVSRKPGLELGRSIRLYAPPAIALLAAMLLFVATYSGSPGDNCKFEGFSFDLVSEIKP